MFFKINWQNNKSPNHTTKNLNRMQEITAEIENEAVYQKKYDDSGSLVNDTTKPIIPVLKFFNKDNQEVYTDEYTLLSVGSKYCFYLHNNNSGLIQKVVIK